MPSGFACRGGFSLLLVCTLRRTFSATTATPLPGKHRPVRCFRLVAHVPACVAEDYISFPVSWLLFAKCQNSCESVVVCALLRPRLQLNPWPAWLFPDIFDILVLLVLHTGLFAIFPSSRSGSQGAGARKLTWSTST